MECISNFKIAFFTKVEYNENFRNKKSKQYIKDALLLNKKKHKTKKIRTLTTNKILSKKAHKYPVPVTNFFFSRNSKLAI